MKPAMSVVQHKTTAIIYAKGKQNVQKLSSAEHDAIITVVTVAYFSPKKLER